MTRKINRHKTKKKKRLKILKTVIDTKLPAVTDVKPVQFLKTSIQIIQIYVTGKKNEIKALMVSYSKNCRWRETYIVFSYKHSIEYLKLAAILVFPIVLLSAYSFFEKEIEWNITLRKTDISGYFVVEDEASGGDLQNAPDSIAEPTTAVVRDTTSQRILFFGDSMLEGLSKRLSNYAAENDHELLNVIWYSSSTKIWGQHTDTLAHFMRDFQPTYIFICLGANELFIRNPDKNETYIKQILEQIGDVQYIWIGPPNWKEDTGINAVIEKTIAPKRFFPSQRLTYERGKDGAHPTYASASQWMDSIAVWMNDSINYRISMRFPQTKQSKGKTVLLQPLK
jgi:hypothetical protein